MTCIVGIQNNGVTFMAGDSCAASGWETRVSNIPKVFINNGWVIGYTSSFRMGQLLQYELKISPPSVIPDLGYMVTIIIPEIRKLLKESGYAKVDSNVETVGTFLISAKGKMFCIQNDLQVQQYRDGFYSIGSGDEYALGAMRAFDLANLRIRDIITDSIEVASYYTGSVKLPVTDIFVTGEESELPYILERE